MKDKTATECWIILKDEIEVIIETFVLIKIKGSDLGRNTSKKSYTKDCVHKIMW